MNKGDRCTYKEPEHFFQPGHPRRIGACVAVRQTEPSKTLGSRSDIAPYGQRAARSALFAVQRLAHDALNITGILIPDSILCLRDPTNFWSSLANRQCVVCPSPCRCPRCTPEHALLCGNHRTTRHRTVRHTPHRTGITALYGKHRTVRQPPYRTANTALNGKQLNGKHRAVRLTPYYTVNTVLCGKHQYTVR